MVTLTIVISNFPTSTFESFFKSELSTEPEGACVLQLQFRSPVSCERSILGFGGGFGTGFGRGLLFGLFGGLLLFVVGTGALLIFGKL